ncbi:hypothetical protein RYX36_015187, partial [Vicia faba]
IQLCSSTVKINRNLIEVTITYTLLHTPIWAVLRARDFPSRYASNPQPLLQPWKLGFPSLSTTIEIGNGVSKCFLDLQEIEKILMNVQANDVKIIPVPKHIEWEDFMVLVT